MSLTKARELRQERKKLYEEAKADVAANPDGFTTEEEERFNKRMARIDELKEQADKIESNHERMARLSDELDVEQEAREDQREFGEKRVSAEEMREKREVLLKRYIGGEVSRQQYLEEYRVIQGQTKGTAAQGGNTVPTDFMPEVQVALRAFGGVREVARILNTDTGRNLQIPTSDDTSNVARIIGEAVAPSTTTRVPFGQVTLEDVMYQSGPIKVSRELLQDSAIDIRAFLADAMGTRFGRGTNAHYTTRSSTETSGPHGFIGDSSGAVAVANNALTPENLLSLLHSIDPAYRVGPNVAWMTSDAGVNEVRALRWGSSRQFVWEPSLKPGQPDRLLGWPLVLNQDTPLEGTSGNKWLWFGNWRHYVVRDIAGLDLMTLTERYAEEGNIAVVGFMRTDGRQVTGSTVIARRPYRCIIQSTG